MVPEILQFGLLCVLALLKVVLASFSSWLYFRVDDDDDDGDAGDQVGGGDGGGSTEVHVHEGGLVNVSVIPGETGH